MAKNIKEIIDKEASEYTRTSARTGIQIPEEVATELKAKFEEIGRFEISVKVLNGIIGYDSEKHRAYSIRNKLNAQYPQAGQLWKVGTTAKNTKYTIAIVDEE